MRRSTASSRSRSARRPLLTHSPPSFQVPGGALKCQSPRPRLLAPSGRGRPRCSRQLPVPLSRRLSPAVLDLHLSPSPRWAPTPALPAPTRTLSTPSLHPRQRGTCPSPPRAPTLGRRRRRLPRLRGLRGSRGGTRGRRLLWWCERPIQTSWISWRSRIQTRCSACLESATCGGWRSEPSEMFPV